jgi:hypothetical protein
MSENFENRETNDLVMDFLANHPGLAKIYNERLPHRIIPDENGKIMRDGQSYDDTPKIRAMIELGDAIRDNVPRPEEGRTRLWRGNRTNEVGYNPSYTNSLDGIALPFLIDYQGVLSYVDITNDEAEKCLVENGVALGAEFIIPQTVLKDVKIVGMNEAEISDLKEQARPLPDSSSNKPGWDII